MGHGIQILDTGCRVHVCGTVCSPVQFVCAFCLVNRVLVRVRVSPCYRVILLCCG